MNIGQFVRAQAILSLSVGVLSFVAYLIIGLPNPFALAVTAGILEAVPIVGPTLGAIQAALVAFPMGTGKLIGVVVSAMIIQLLENNLLVPRVMNQSVGVHPILTLLSLVTLTSLLGIPGGILAIPFASAVQVIFREIRDNVDHTQTVQRRILMSNGNDGGFGTFMSGLFIGGVIGAAFGILKAPQSGDETIALLKRKSVEARTELERATLEARLRAEQLLAEVEARAEEFRKMTEQSLAEQQAKIEAVAEEAKKAYQQEQAEMEEAQSES